LFGTRFTSNRGNSLIGIPRCEQICFEHIRKVFLKSPSRMRAYNATRTWIIFHTPQKKVCHAHPNAHKPPKNFKK